MQQSDGDPLELEEQYHNSEEMCALSVIEGEIELMTQMITESKDPNDRDFYQSKKESLEFARDSLYEQV